MHSNFIPKYSSLGESIPPRVNEQASFPQTPRYYSSAVEGYLNINPDIFSQVTINTQRTYLVLSTNLLCVKFIMCYSACLDRTVP